MTESTKSWPDFREVDWNDLYPRLLLFGVGKMRPLLWRGQRNGVPPGAMSAQDLVHTAITKALSGERSYNPEQSLFINLCQVISSELSNVVRSSENRKVKMGDEENIINLIDFRDTPEEASIRDDTEDKFREFLRERDSTAAKMADRMILEGETSSLELAQALSMSQRDVENVKKRLRRLTLQYLERDRVLPPRTRRKFTPDFPEPL
jgi:RNA polymerase sigma factor (sigma-70 family)